MTVIALTFVRGGTGLLGISTRSNLRYVDEAHFVLGPGSGREEQLLNEMALDGLPVYISKHVDDISLPNSLEFTVSSLREERKGDAIVLVLETDDLLTADMRGLSAADTANRAFALPRHIAYDPTQLWHSAAPGKLTLRQETRPSSYVLGFHLHNSNERLRTVDDRFSGHPTFFGPPNAALDNYSVIRVPVRTVEQFFADTANAWLAVEARSGVKSAAPSTAGAWLSQAKNLMIDSGMQVSDEDMWSWCETQLSPTVVKTLNIASNYEHSNHSGPTPATLRLLSNSTAALDRLRNAEHSTRSALHRERLLRVHDVLSILLTEIPWHKTWVWKDRAAVLELRWAELTVAFDIFVTSDEINVQLVSRDKKPISNISAYLGRHGIDEIKLPGKPGRYVIGAIPIKRSSFTVSQIAKAADIIRPLATGMSQ